MRNTSRVKRPAALTSLVHHHGLKTSPIVIFTRQYDSVNIPIAPTVSRIRTIRGRERGREIRVKSHVLGPIWWFGARDKSTACQDSSPGYHYHRAKPAHFIIGLGASHKSPELNCNTCMGLWWQGLFYKCHITAPVRSSEINWGGEWGEHGCNIYLVWCSWS